MVTQTCKWNIKAIVKDFWGNNIAKESFTCDILKDFDRKKKELAEKYKETAYYIYFYSEGQRIDLQCVNDYSQLKRKIWKNKN